MDVTITNAATATSEEIPIELVRMLIAFGTAARVSYVPLPHHGNYNTVWFVLERQWTPQYNGEMAMTTKAEKKVTMALFTYCMYWPT